MDISSIVYRDLHKVLRRRYTKKKICSFCVIKEVLSCVETIKILKKFQP